MIAPNPAIRKPLGFVGDPKDRASIWSRTGNLTGYDGRLMADDRTRGKPSNRGNGAPANKGIGQVYLSPRASRTVIGRLDGKSPYTSCHRPDTGKKRRRKKGHAAFLATSGP